MAQSHSSCLFPNAPWLLGRNFAVEGLLEMAFRIFTLPSSTPAQAKVE
jgi:hypothetical protein